MEVDIFGLKKEAVKNKQENNMVFDKESIKFIESLY